MKYFQLFVIGVALIALSVAAYIVGCELVDTGKELFLWTLAE